MKLSALAVMLFVTVTFGTAPASGDVGAQTVWDKIDAYVTVQMKEGQIPGLALAIRENGETVYQKGYGAADSKGTPVTPQTVFMTGSIGKTFTALAIRQLANRGLIDYEAPVRAYIPWFTLADEDAAAKIRIIDLVQHKSGLSAASGITPAAYNETYSLEQAVRRLASVKPVRSPGLHSEYCNLNYMILGLVVERVSGMPYADYIQENILGPLGMDHSYPSKAMAGAAGIAQGHYVMYGAVVPNREPIPPGMVPAGFQAASAGDLARFASLYLTNGYIDGVSAIPGNALPERKPGAPFDKGAPRYGIYFAEESGDPQGFLGYIGHAGATNGFTTVLLVNPANGRAIVVMANCHNANIYPEITAQTIGNGIASILNSGAVPGDAYTRPGLAVNLCVLAAVLAFVVFHAVRAPRFRNAMAKGGLRRFAALASLILLDALLPAAVLAGVPLLLDCTWRYLLNSNMELWWPLFVVSILLACTGAAKLALHFARSSGNADAARLCHTSDGRASRVRA